MSIIHKINLTHFRSYEVLRLDTAAARIIVLTGENGAGKTNILEAISLLVPGRGLRGAELEDFKNRDSSMGEPWGIAAEVETKNGLMMRIGTGLEKEGQRRQVRIDGKDAKNQSALGDVLAAVWLTPQMDRIFLEGPSARRKFLDRLVLAHDPAHGTHLARYEKNLRQRLKILTGEVTYDARWLDTLEEQIAGDGVQIAIARQNLLLHLGKHIAILSQKENLFPAPLLGLDGWIDGAIAVMPAVAAEEEMRKRLNKSRAADAAASKTLEGPHRSDFVVTYAAKDMPARECSTGEQKGLLLSIILAHALMIKDERGFVPVLLLDEVAAHLDETRRRHLFRLLAEIGGQVFLTGTDTGIFDDLRGRALFFTVDNGRLHQEKKLAAV